MTLPAYPEYRDSGVDWLGEIPAHWALKPVFGEFVEKNTKNKGMVEKTVLSLSYGRIVVKPAEKLHGLVPESFETYQIIEPGDIIIRTTDLQNDHTSIRVGISQHHGIITSAYMCIRTWNDLIPDYGYLLLSVFDLTKAIYGYGAGLRQNLSFEHIKRMLVAVPPTDEQAAIVRYLDAADRRIRQYIRAKQKLIKLLNEQKQAIIQQAVTRGLNPDVPMKDSGVEWLGEIPAHWEITSLRHHFNIQLGKMLDSKKITNLNSVPYLRNRDVQWGAINTSNLPYMDILPEEFGRYTLKTGDLLVCEGGDVGRSAFWEGQLEICGYQKALHRVRAIDPQRSQAKFLYYLMFIVSKLGVFISDGSESTIPHLTNEKLKAYRFPFPTYIEQGAIVDFLDNFVSRVDSQIVVIKDQINLIREYRTRLIADVVTGKVDVRGAVFNLPEDFQDEALPDADDLSDDLDGLDEDDEMIDITEGEEA